MQPVGLRGLAVSSAGNQYSTQLELCSFSGRDSPLQHAICIGTAAKAGLHHKLDHGWSFCTFDQRFRRSAASKDIWPARKAIRQTTWTCRSWPHTGRADSGRRAREEILSWHSANKCPSCRILVLLLFDSRFGRPPVVVR